MGSLLASEEGQQLWGPLVKPLEMTMAQLAGGLDAYSEARVRFLDYAGAVVCRVWMDPDTDNPSYDVRLTADGLTDLGKLRADLAGALARFHGAAWQGDGDEQPRVLAMPSGDRISEPQMVSEDLVFVIAPLGVLDAAIERAHGPLPAAARAALKRGRVRPFRLVFDVHQAVQLSRDSDVTKPFGLQELGDLTLELHAKGPHLAFDLQMGFLADERYTFGALFPDRQGVPGIARLVEGVKGVSGWKAGHFDMQALHRTLVALGDAYDFDLIESFGDRDESFLSHLSSGYVMLGEVPEEGRSLWSTKMVFAFRVADAEAFETIWEKVRSTFVFGRDRIVEHEGVEIHGAGSSFCTAFGRGLFLMGHGSGAEEQIKQLLDAARDNTDWHKQPYELPKALSSVKRFAPEGFNGIARGDVALVMMQVESLWDMLSAMAMDLPEIDLGLTGERSELVKELLKAHNLLNAHSMTGFADDVWRFRVLW